MSAKWLVVGALVMGAVGQVACVESAEAAEEVSANGMSIEEGNKVEGGQFCGGFAGIACPEGLICVDDPRDSCDPTRGGADCGGVCVDPESQKTPKCEYADPNLSYVSREPSECPAMLFRCAEGSTAFFNDCGCGCQITAKACNYNDPNRSYVSKDPAQCATIRFVCNEGESAFFDSCGCGCEVTSTP